MTETEAKELLIDGMNYAAYKETDHSLWPADKNKLFGAVHYEDTARTESVWGNGDDWDRKMADLLRLAIHLGSTTGDYRQAIAVLRQSDDTIGRVIRRAGF